MMKSEEQKQKEKKAMEEFAALSLGFDAILLRMQKQYYKGRCKKNGDPERRTKEGRAWVI